MYIFIYSGLEIGGVTSQNANHFRSNCESFWQSICNIVNHLLRDLRVTFRKMTFFSDLRINFFGPYH